MVILDPFPLGCSTSLQNESGGVQWEINLVENLIPCQSVIKFEESRCPSILCCKARIDKEHEITSTNVNVDMVPNVGADLLFDIVDRKLLKDLSASKSKNGDSLKAIK